MAAPSFFTFSSVAFCAPAAPDLSMAAASVAISFAPYAEETLQLGRAAQQRGVPIVLLTDRLTSPLARQAAAVLTVTELDFGAFRAPTATIAVAVALSVAVASARDGGQE